MILLRSAQNGKEMSCSKWTHERSKRCNLNKTACELVAKCSILNWMNRIIAKNVSTSIVAGPFYLRFPHSSLFFIAPLASSAFSCPFLFIYFFIFPLCCYFASCIPTDFYCLLFPRTRKQSEYMTMSNYFWLQAHTCETTSLCVVPLNDISALLLIMNAARPVNKNDSIMKAHEWVASLQAPGWVCYMHTKKNVQFIKLSFMKLYVYRWWYIISFLFSYFYFALVFCHESSARHPHSAVFTLGLFAIVWKGKKKKKKKEHETSQGKICCREWIAVMLATATALYACNDDSKRAHSAYDFWIVTARRTIDLTMTMAYRAQHCAAW